MAILRIRLRDTDTGEEAWHEEYWADDRVVEGDPAFYWTDGNGGCDCERLRVLHAALGQPDPRIPCGDTRVVIMEGTLDGKPLPEIADRS